MKLDEEIQQWRERAIGKPYPYLMIDARYEKVRRGGEVISQGVLIVSASMAMDYGKCWACGWRIPRARPVGARCSAI